MAGGPVSAARCRAGTAKGTSGLLVMHIMPEEYKQGHVVDESLLSEAKS